MADGRELARAGYELVVRDADPERQQQFAAEHTARPAAPAISPPPRSS